MNAIKLSFRLSAIAGQVPADARVADVGTDHGYIPVWLIKNGIVQRVTATDIGRGPLERAVETAREAGVTQGIRFALCDGLGDIAPEEAEVVIIAGMGGGTIAGILSRAPWTRDCKKLILQPMTKPELLRQWLLENGYVIIDERLVKDSGKIYCVISAKGGSSNESYRPHEMVISPILAEKRDPLLMDYLEEQLKKYRRAAAGLEKSIRDRDSERLERQRTIIVGLTDIQEKLKLQ